ncbi:MAG: DUF4332 domain-containing protein [Candidatus Zixiibacteriota bacterium]
MPSLARIEGIGVTNAEKLKKTGITTTQALLERGATPRGRQEIAHLTGIDEKTILRWVNLSDLFRIRGIGQEYSDLLEEAGVDTVPEIAQRNPQSLHEILTRVNDEKHLVRQMPSQATVATWIESAQNLPRVIRH